MKIGLIRRNLPKVYLYLVLLNCITAGCLGQSADMISQKNKNATGPLVASKSSSHFNYFSQNADKSKEESSGKVKISGTNPVEEFQGFHQIPLTTQSTPAAQQQTELTSSKQQLQKPVKKTATGISENWRSKSLIASAKRYPAQIARKLDENTDRIRQASSSFSQGISSGFQQVSNDVPADAPAHEVAEQGRSQTASSGKNESEDSRPDHSLASAKEVDRLLAEANQQNLLAELSELAKDLHQDRDQNVPAFEDINQEMRRLQINSVMDRARRELAGKNYEYAEFLAAQALESSYRGHVAFGLDEESPQMLLDKIKKQIKSIPPPEVQRVQHAEPAAKSNGGQTVPNFQFRPSRVHPLKRRAVEQPESQGIQPKTRIGGSDEMPLIVPRNLGSQPQKIQIQPGPSAVNQKSPQSSGISLEPPSFDSPTEAEASVPVVEQEVEKKTTAMPSAPSLKLELEEVSEDLPAKIRLSGPETKTQPQVMEEKNAAGAGPQLMLPKLPAMPGDLTSQAKPGRETSAAPVNFRPKNQGTAQEKGLENLQKQRSRGEQPVSETGLTLDEIEWDLEERKKPQDATGWWGIPTLLMIAGGAIILLLLSIIVILLKRGTSIS